MLAEHTIAGADEPRDVAMVATANEMVDIMLGILADGLDHPELWLHIPDYLGANPMIADVLLQRLAAVRGATAAPI